jgi:PBP1b-binding outer membrane lipoprotein LpoB
MRKMKLCAVLLSSLVLLTGCGRTAAGIVSNELCNDWRHATISKKDVLTEETASQIEASNKSRPAWGCKYGEPSS